MLDVPRFSRRCVHPQLVALCTVSSSLRCVHSTYIPSPARLPAQRSPPSTNGKSLPQPQSGRCNPPILAHNPRDPQSLPLPFRHTSPASPPPLRSAAQPTTTHTSIACAASSVSTACSHALALPRGATSCAIPSALDPQLELTSRAPAPATAPFLTPSASIPAQCIAASIRVFLSPVCIYVSLRSSLPSHATTIIPSMPAHITLHLTS